MPNTNLIDQEYNERRYSRKHINEKIKESILSNPVMLDRISCGVKYLEQWLELPKPDTTDMEEKEAQAVLKAWERKKLRLEPLHSMDLEELVIDIFVGIAYFRREELFTSVTSQLAGKVGFSEKVDAIQTMAEICAVLCWTDAFDINKHAKMASLMIQSKIPLEPTLINFIEDSEYLPPMVCPPRKLESNYDSGYLTHKESLILRNNHHDGDICLDVLNIMNSVKLKLNIDFLCQYEEKPTFDFETDEQKKNWYSFKKQSYCFYKLIVDQGNQFWLTHKVDKRGRIYSQGYHINSQGAAFKKAMIQLADEEYVDGVPNF